MKIINYLNPVLFLSVLVLFFSCEIPDTGGDGTDDGHSLNVSIEDGARTIDIDESITLKAIVTDSEDREVSIEWYVDDVKQSGESGDEFIFSSSNAGSYSIKVKVSCEEDTATDTADMTVEQMLNFTKTSSIAPDPEAVDPTYTAVFSDGTNILLGTQLDGVIYSKDYGSAWDYLNTDDELSHDQINCVTADSSSSEVWYFGTFDGLSVYDSSTSEMNTYEIGSSIQVDDIVIDGDYIYMATNSGIAVSDKTTVSFIYYDTSDGLPADGINNIYIDGTVIYAATESGFAYATLTDGTPSGWTVINSGDGLGSDSVADIYADGTKIIVWTSSDISVSSDGGSNWSSYSAVSGGATGTAMLDGIIHSVGYGSHLVSSTDGGSSWQEVELPDAPYWFGYNNNGICTDGSRLYIIHTDGLLIGTVD